MATRSNTTVKLTKTLEQRFWGLTSSGGLGEGAL